MNNQIKPLSHESDESTSLSVRNINITKLLDRLGYFSLIANNENLTNLYTEFLSTIHCLEMFEFFIEIETLISSPEMHIDSINTNITNIYETY